MSTADMGVATDVVLGFGNPLMGDDGLGIAVAALLRAQWEDEPGLAVVDGGTWGMNLLPLIEQAHRLLIVDAIDRGLEPGARVVLEREEIPRYFGHTLSPHQLDLREVLALAELRATLPYETRALGVQPERVELSLDLSASVAGALPNLLSEINGVLAKWGHVEVASDAARA